MTKIIAAILLALCATCAAQSVSVTWTFSTDTNVSGYWLYRSSWPNQAITNCDKWYIPGRTTSATNNIPIGWWVTNYFFMTATSSVMKLESLRSPEVPFQLLPSGPMPTINLNWKSDGMTNVEWIVYGSPNLRWWTPVSRHAGPPVTLPAIERNLFLLVASTKPNP